MKSRLLVLQLWGLGDLAITCPFLGAAANKYQVGVVAKPQGRELLERFIPSAEVIPFSAPWTAFQGKYLFWRWNWRVIFRLRTHVRDRRYDAVVSARSDPREHVFMWLLGCSRRIGIPHLGSSVFLTDAVPRNAAMQHRYEDWRAVGEPLGIPVTTYQNMTARAFESRPGRRLIVHTGAARSVRVWPLERYARLAKRLERVGYQVTLLCDDPQHEYLAELHPAARVAPCSISDFVNLLAESAAFVGNDSGPGHIAALCGVPTFTIFGPQLPEWFVPVHPAADFLSGARCPYKPCFDSCRFPSPVCIEAHTEEEVWQRVTVFLSRVIPAVVPSVS